MNTILLKPGNTLRTLSFALLIIPLMLPFQAQADDNPIVGGGKIPVEQDGNFNFSIGSDSETPLSFGIFNGADIDSCYTTTVYTSDDASAGENFYVYNFPDSDKCKPADHTDPDWYIKIFSEDDHIETFKFTYDDSNIVRALVPIGIYCFDDSGVTTCRCSDSMQATDKCDTPE